jgi:hypothetical protein
MPRKSDSIPINNPQNDRRVKLTDLQRKEILQAKDKLSQRQLAEMYGVSRRTITFIHNPEALIENKKRRSERGGSKVYYDKDYHRMAMKEHRDHKKELFNQGKLKP